MPMFDEAQYKCTIECNKLSVAGTLADYYGSHTGSIDFDNEVRPRIERVRLLVSAHNAYYKAMKQEATVSQIADAVYTIAELRDELSNLSIIHEDEDALVNAMLADVTELLYKKTRVTEPVSQYDLLFED